MEAQLHSKTSIPSGKGSGHIVIYDPVHVSADGILAKLWNSDDWGWSGTQEQASYRFFNKFMPPVIDGGEIILPNYAGGVLIIGQEKSQWCGSSPSTWLTMS
jgi:hypothetical protein